MTAGAAGDGIIGVDDRGIIRFCNSAAAALFARPMAQLAGQSFGVPLVAEESTEIDVVRPDGETVAVDIRATETTADGTRLHVATLRGVTEHRQAERDLETALEHQRIVVGVAAHELKSPLFGIQMMVDALRGGRETFTEAQRKAILDRISDRITALQARLRKFLITSRIDSTPDRPAVERLSVLDVVSELLTAFNGAARPVEVSCPPALAVLANHSDFAEMIDNYVDNAFTHGGPPVEVRVRADGDWVELRVCDRGPGVPPVFISALFQRFSRALSDRDDVEGTGLGLWIVASLAAKNGGHAWYEPHSDGGACFCLRLPQAPHIRPG